MLGSSPKPFNLNGDPICPIAAALLLDQSIMELAGRQPRSVVIAANARLKMDVLKH